MNENTLQSSLVGFVNKKSHSVFFFYVIPDSIFGSENDLLK